MVGRRSTFGHVQPRVLVIDDDGAIGLLLRLNLEQHGCEVVLRTDSLDGLAWAQSHQLDVILLDLMMPLVDGFQVLRELKKDDRTKDVPVIVLTAVALTGPQEQARQLGAYAVVTKPFHPDRLMVVLADAVAEGQRGVEEIAPTAGALSPRPVAELRPGASGRS